MKMKYFLPALLLVPSLAMSATAQTRTNESSGLPQAYGSEGREVAAPPWSFACMTGPRPKPMQRALVDLWQPRRARAILESVLTLTSA